MAQQPVVLVTGCSTGGIGSELCKEFASQKCRVFASARRLEAMEDLKELGLELVKLDVTSESSVAEAINEVVTQAGRIDILVNNAGAGCVGPLAELPLDKIRANFDTNVFSIISMVHAVAPVMAKQGGGKIVNVGSIVSWVSTPWGGSYCATKAAVHSLTSTLRMELKPFNIDVMLLIPGAIKSNIGHNNITNMDLSYLDLYASYKEQLEARAMVSQGASSLDTAAFAKATVNKILSRRMPTQFILGGMSLLFWTLSFFPPWVGEFFMCRRFGLKKPNDTSPSESKDD